MSAPFGPDGGSVSLVPVDRGFDEKLVVDYPDDSKETLRLQDYAGVYSHAGLYEEVVHRQLGCASPLVVATLLVATAAAQRVPTSDLRVLDLGAGNGMVGAALAQYGVPYVVGLDDVEEARVAADRDHPGVYDYYLVGGDVSSIDEMRRVVESRRINAVTCAGAIGHLPFDAFERLVGFLPLGALVAFSFYDAVQAVSDPVEDTRSPIAAYLRRERDARRLLGLRSFHFRHRLAMDGSPIPGAVVSATTGEQP